MTRRGSPLLKRATLCWRGRNRDTDLWVKGLRQLCLGVEIQAIEDAIEYPLETVSNHISQALQLFADRKDPDYRNSIKESISAVEALCRAIAGDDKATLSQALHIIERQGKVRIHPALIEGLSKIYGYTSDESGIRHALIENKEPSTSADAQFMLIMCSAFIHYLSRKGYRCRRAT